MFELSEQTWKMRDGEGGYYVVRHLLIGTELAYCAAWHWPAPIEDTESVKVEGAADYGYHATPGAAFAACLEHQSSRKLASAGPRDIDADGRPVETGAVS